MLDPHTPSLYPQPTRESGNIVSSPSGVRGRAPTEELNEFGYCTAVSIILVAIVLMILRFMFYTRNLNNVSYREHRASAFMSQNHLARVCGVVDRVTIFDK